MVVRKLAFIFLPSLYLTGCFFAFHASMNVATSLLPTLASTSPLSPAPNNEPSVIGATQPNASVTLYSDSACTQVLAQGTANSSGGFSIPVMVAAGATTTIYANASDSHGTTSGCTPTPITYTENSTCTGVFEPFASQHGGGQSTEGAAVIHGNCATYVAGQNSINASGSGFLANATEYGAGGSPGTSVYVTKYDYKGYLLSTSEYAMTNANANVAGMVQDSSGNLYVAGTVSCVSGQTCSFGGSVSGTTGLNANGNSNIFVMKFNSSGVFQWVSQLGGGTVASGPSIMAKAVTIDGSGNVYVAGGAYNLVGTEIGSHGQIDSFVTKMSSSGTIVWTSQMGNGGTSDYIAYGVAVDGSGKIDVAGSAQGALLANQLSANAHGFNDVFVNQLTSTGGNNWSYQVGNGGDMWGTTLMTDSSNNIYIAGYTDGLLTPSPISATMYGNHGLNDSYLMKFNSTGTYQWTSQYGTKHAAMTLGLLGGSDLSMDSSNYLYLIGAASGYLGGGCYNNCGGAGDTFVQKMSSTGAFDWVTQIGSTSAVGGSVTGATPFAISTDANGNSYISSVTNSLMAYLFGSHKTDNLVATVDSTGAFNMSTSTPQSASTPYWPQQQGANATVDGYSIAQDSNGNFWVTGDSTGSVVTSPGLQFGVHGTDDVYLSKFDSSGNLKCTDQLGASGASTIGNGIVVDSTSGLDIAGSTTATIGTQLGTHGSQDLFLANFPGCGGTPSVIQYGASGATLSGMGVVEYSGAYFVTGSTSAYLGGTQTGSHGTNDVFLAKFTSGALSWANQLGVSSGTTKGAALAQDGAGNFYMTGYTTGSLGGTQYGTHGSEDLYLTKYNAAGAFQWVVQLGASGANTVGSELAMDGSNILVVGYTTGNLGGIQDGYHGTQDLVLASFSSNGAENWVHQLGTQVPCVGGEACNGFLQGSTAGSGVAVDGAGDIYVTGYATGLATNDTQYGSHGVDDAIIAEYSSSGTYKWMSNYGLTSATTKGWNITPSSVSPRTVLITGTTNGFLGGTQYGTQSTDMFILGADGNGLMP